MTSEPGRVLVVDDQGVNRMLLCHYLEENGFEPSAVATCEEALAAVAGSEYDVVLLDIVMPGMGGIELLRVLRDRYSLTELPIIMATARTESADVVEALELGANDYITKPVDVPVAVARIRTHLHLRRMDRQLRESEERYALAVRGANEGLWDWDLRSDRVYYSPRFKLLLGQDEDAFVGKPAEWLGLIHPQDADRVNEEIQDHLRGAVPHLESQHRIMHTDGTYRWVLVRGLAVHDEDGKPYRMAGSISDITTSRMYDNVTGLPNRQLLLDVTERALARVTRRPELLFAVLVVGVDQFDLLLSTLGQFEADRLLSMVARRLQLASRASDTVSRLEGPRFGILLDEIRHVSDANRVANRIARSLADPIPAADRNVRITASIGIAMSATGYDRPEHALRDATTAMSQATVHGGNRHEMFDHEMQEQAEERIRLESDLRQAIDRNEFLMHFQPILDLKTGAPDGFEALVRWRHPERGMISPVHFIPICEATGLVVPLGTWILRASAEAMHRWHGMHPAFRGLTISVNLSGRQLAEPDLVPTVARILKETRLDPTRLKLEITESVLMHHFETAVQTMRALKDMGIRLSIDDFGTGYSSLSHLHQFPIDYLKVDRSFVSRLGPDEHDWEIVRVIVALARHLKMHTIAEGVEDEEQASILKTLGCDYVQGYLYSPPIDAERATAWLEERMVKAR